ncbi:hypothetical protein HBN50_08210 [Halobacteriovorax sp. GB3]|uniref:hypothetical protein n=1 Tax=Halobacteriovorax sp. GB3 TaxID=2719615 RepID=UPI002361A7FB|nr:hypothetical protein [Halobacteriovorax sp. GB3]MDD0853076.1 hypothetical protein [Halobacteriovorax sp. GB3]
MKTKKIWTKLILTHALLWSSPNFIWAIEHNAKKNAERIERAKENFVENVERENVGLDKLRVITTNNPNMTALEQFNALSEAEKEALASETEQLVATSGCEAVSVHNEKIKQDAEVFEKRLTNQSYSRDSGHFETIESLRQKLDQQSGTMGALTGGIGPLAGNQETILAKRDEMRREMYKLEQLMPAKHARIDKAEKALENCYDDDGKRQSYKCNNEVYAKRKQEVTDSKLDLQLTINRIKFLQNAIRKIIMNDGRRMTANADQAVSKANAQGKTAEQTYELLNDEIAAKEQENTKALEDAMQRLELAKRKSRENLQNLQMSNNADFRIWDSLKTQLAETSDQDPANIMRIENDIDLLATSSSAVSQLRCQDISDVKVKSYPLFKAASANYMAAMINERTEFTKMTAGCYLSCTGIEDIKADQANGGQKYPQFIGKDLSTIKPNCQTFAGRDGMLINDPNPDDDKDEQIKAIERAANLQNNLVTNAKLKKVHREEVKTMFTDAYNAAMMEYSTKVSRVAAATAQLARAKAWQNKAKNSILIYIAVVAMLATCASWSCPSAYAAAVAILLWHRKDKKKADKDVAKWEKKLRESKMHGHLACNYPGESTEAITVIDFEGKGRDPMGPSDGYSLMDITDEIPFIYDKNTVWELTDMAPPLSGKKQIIDKATYEKRLDKGATKRRSYGGSFYDRLDNMKNDVGLNSQARSYDVYLTKKLGAWRLQTFNASKMIDYRPTVPKKMNLIPMKKESETTYQWTSSSYNESSGKKIVTDTGFPAPETRIVYMQQIMNLLNTNLDYMDDTIAMSTIYANQYAQLLARTRSHLKLGDQGLEEDTSKAKTVKTMECASGACQKATTLKGLNFKAPTIELDNTTANKNKALIKSNSMGANTAGAVDIQQTKKSAIRSRNTSKKLSDSSQDKTSGSSSTSNSQANKNQFGDLNRRRNANGDLSKSFDSNGSNSASNGNSSGSSSHASLNGTASDSGSSANSASSSASSNIPSAISLSSSQKSALNKKVDEQYQNRKKGINLDFSSYDKTDFDDTGSEFSFFKKDGVDYKAKTNEDGSTSIYDMQGNLVGTTQAGSNGYGSYGSYGANGAGSYGSNGYNYKNVAHPKAGPSLFNIVSKRYQKSAYSVLLP